MRRRAEISQRRFGLGTALVLGKSLDKVRDCLDLAEGLECSNHARQRPNFRKPYEQIKYTRLTQSCRRTGYVSVGIDHDTYVDGTLLARAFGSVLIRSLASICPACYRART